MKEVARGVDTYWMNEPLRFATTHKHTLSIEGETLLSGMVPD